MQNFDFHRTLLRVKYFMFNIFHFFLQRYHGAHVLLHALQFQTQNEEDKKSLAHYKDAVERRLHILEQQGFVQVYETPS